MVKIEQIDPRNKAHVNRFIRLHYRLYKDHPQWVPPFIGDLKTMLNPDKHPYYEHSTADFFIATRDGRDVGKIAALHNKPFNEYQGKREAVFYLFDCENDQEAANCLFERVFAWATDRGLDTLVGPKGFSLFDGYGIQIEGHDQRQMMNMMNYNFPYYQTLVENLGFEKEVDFVSCYLEPKNVHFSDRIHQAADKVIKRGTFEVQRFKNKRDLLGWAGRLGQAYNNTFVNNWEYYPQTEREIKYVIDSVLMVADPSLIKIISRKDEVAGFLFAFPDISAAMQRAQGHLNPLSIADMLLELRRTEWISLNGAGVLPEYQGLGGNLLMYSEMEKTICSGRFKHADLTQVAETASFMRQDLINVGGRAYKNHRVFHRKI